MDSGCKNDDSDRETLRHTLDREEAINFTLARLRSGSELLLVRRALDLEHYRGSFPVGDQGIGFLPRFPTLVGSRPRSIPAARTSQGVNYSGSPPNGANGATHRLHFVRNGAMTAVLEA